jgi:hypothetical protein
VHCAWSGKYLDNFTKGPCFDMYLQAFTFC